MRKRGVEAAVAEVEVEVKVVAWWDVVRSKGATECADGAPGQ